MKLRLKFKPPVFLLSTTDDTSKGRVELVEDQDYVGQEQYQMYEALQHVGGLGVPGTSPWLANDPLLSQSFPRRRACSWHSIEDTEVVAKAQDNRRYPFFNKPSERRF